MSNREYIIKCMNVYDFLLSMQKRLEDFNNSLVFPDDTACIMDVLGVSNVGFRHADSGGDCGRCIETWLNEGGWE